MHKLAQFALAALLTAPLFASSIPLPYDTGSLNNGTVAPGGSVDLHYTDSDSANTVYVDGTPNSQWIPVDGVSAWISPDMFDGGRYGGADYQLDYRVTFNLTGYVASSVVLTGQWASDNSGSILLNGVSAATNNCSGYQQWSTFTLAGFDPGLNQIDFDWTNTNGPGGLRVEFLSATGNSLTPEPASLFLLGLGVTALGLVRRRRAR